MITWNVFIYFAIPSVLLWMTGAWGAWKDRKLVANLFTVAGLLLFFSFIVGMWISLERPPLRTMGETRLWYSAFLPLAGIIVYVRWHYKWILSFSTLMALVFICINIFKPEIHSKTLMPALQSPWFAPHVIIYMFCYAILGAATLVAVAQLVRRGDRVKSEERRVKNENYSDPSCVKQSADPNSNSNSSFFTLHSSIQIQDNLVTVGLGFMTIGMLFGALWAKEAWGHYWAWDPKETWAAATWLLFLGYIHIRRAEPLKLKLASWLLIISFCCLQMCWWGINYLPTAQGNSVHTYNLN